MYAVQLAMPKQFPKVKGPSFNQLMKIRQALHDEEIAYALGNGLDMPTHNYLSADQVAGTLQK